MSYAQLLSLETTSQSKFSPCLIDPSETVARVLFAPKHYNLNKVQPNAFEQIIHEGMSVLRTTYSFEDNLKKTISKIESEQKQYVGFITANVNEIRKVLVPNEVRLFIVIDTARETVIGHADVETTRKYIIDITNVPKNMIPKVIVGKLFMLFDSELKQSL